MGDVYILNGKILSGLPNHAKDIEFDNTGTTLSSTNTEDAIKEVNSNLPKLLWTNPAPSTAFSGQNITLDNSNYDILLTIFRVYPTADNFETSALSLKGDGIMLNGALAKARFRRATRQSDTSYTFDDGYLVDPYGTEVVDNTQCVPLRIYGIKL